MGEREPRETELQRVIEAFRLRPTDIVRVARRIARERGKKAVSRYHLNRLATGRGEATAGRIFIITAAIQELTSAAIRAGDLFEVEPQFARAPAVAYVAGANSSNLFAPLSSPAQRLSRIRRPPLSEETGISDEAFEALYRDYGALLRALANRRYGIPSHDAEAIVQETFLRYLQRHTYVRDVRGFLYRSVCNACIDYLRERKRECPLLPEHDETIDEGRQAAHEQWVRKFTVSAVIARLGEKCRETLHGYYLRDEKRSALAHRLSTTPGNIDQLISICKRRAVQLYRDLTFKGK